LCFDSDLDFFSSLQNEQKPHFSKQNDFRFHFGRFASEPKTNSVPYSLCKHA
jgi:hypothetical protein